MRMLLFLLLLLPAWPGSAQNDLTLAPFLGHWQSDGDAFNAPARSTMRWTATMKDKQVRLDYRIEIQPDTEQSSVFEGVAYYRDTGQSSLRAFWADNSGDLHPIVASFDGEALTAHWGVAGAKQGRTRYRLTGEDEIQVTDWVLTDDGWRQFNDNRFVRIQPAASTP